MLTLAEGASFLKVSRTKLRELWLEEGLPIVRLSSRTYRIDEAALQEWLAKRTVTGWRVENGAPARSTPSKAVRTGAFPSRRSQIRSDDEGARNGSSARRRPPNDTSLQSSAVSIAGFRQRKAQ